MGGSTLQRVASHSMPFPQSMLGEGSWLDQTSFPDDCEVVQLQKEKKISCPKKGEKMPGYKIEYDTTHT